MYDNSFFQDFGVLDETFIVDRKLGIVATIANH